MSNARIVSATPGGLWGDRASLKAQARNVVRLRPDHPDHPDHISVDA